MGWALLGIAILVLDELLGSNRVESSVPNPAPAPDQDQASTNPPQPEYLQASQDEQAEISDETDDVEVRPEDDPYYCSCGCGHYMQGD